VLNLHYLKGARKTESELKSILYKEIIYLLHKKTKKKSVKKSL